MSVPAGTSGTLNHHPHMYSHFELVRPFNHGMMPWKFRDDISNGSGVIVFADRQTDRQTDKHTHTNGHYSERIPP